MKKRLLAGLLATSIALSISMGAFPAMAATNDDFVEDREDIADYTDDSYSSGYSPRNSFLTTSSSLTWMKK